MMRRLPFLIALLPLIAASPAGPSKSALEADPSGWTDLLARAGKDLDNWARAPIHAKDRLNPQNQWSIDEVTGNLICEGDKGHEWLRYRKELGDFVFHVEWRFTPVTTGKKGYNSGIYARNSEDATTWLQAQTGDASGGYIFGEAPRDGKLAGVNLSKQVQGKPVKPAGEWNTFEITCKGKDMSLWVNGQTTCEWHDCGALRGYVGLEAEGYRIEFRKVMLKEL
jgi:hypothetical protein